MLTDEIGFFRIYMIPYKPPLRAFFVNKCETIISIYLESKTV